MSLLYCTSICYNHGKAVASKFKKIWSRFHKVADSGEVFGDAGVRRECSFFGITIVWTLLLLTFTVSSAGAFPSITPFTLTNGYVTSNGATVSNAGTGININFPSSASNPSVVWSAGSSWNWSAGAQLAVTVVNTGTAAAPLLYSIYDSSGDYVYAGYTASIDLTAGTANDSLATYGMINPPPVLTGSTVWMADRSNVNVAGHTTISLSQIASVKLWMKAPTAACTVNVQSVSLYEPAPISSLYQGIVDAYGQFSSGTWTNKITTNTNLTANLLVENNDIGAHTGMYLRDAYGGWNNGSTYTTTGFFSTYQDSTGKWWLIDPLGHLFISQGINHMFPSATGTLSYEHASDGNSGNTTFTGNPSSNTYRNPMFTTIRNDSHAATFSAVYGPFTGTYTTYDFYGSNVDTKYCLANGYTYNTGACLAPWLTQTLSRMSSWGFNTVGNFSDVGLFAGTSKIPYTAYFHSATLSGTSVAGIPDPYDTQNFITGTAAQMTTNVPSVVYADKYCIGYICDNERGWGEYPFASDYLTNIKLRYKVAIAALALNSTTSPAKAAFVSQMTTEYTTIGSLNTAWGTSFASWAAMGSPYTVPASPTSQMKTDMGTYTTNLAETYASEVKQAIQQVDRVHLYLGCGIATCSPEALAGFAQVMDVITLHVYQPTLDPNAFSFTNTLGKPFLLNEFSFGALDTGMFGYGYQSQRTANQTDRADAYVSYVSSVLSMKAFVGSHWFEYVNEPLTGRAYDGEDYNFGFLDVADNPSQPMVDAARVVNNEIYDFHSNSSMIWMEAESTPVAASYTVAGGGYQTINDPSLSGGMAVQLNATANGDYVTFATPVVAPGSYDVRVAIEKGPALGKWWLYVGDASNFTATKITVGSPPTDEYAAATTYQEVDLGTWSPTTAASSKWFQFLVTNKDSHSSGNTLIIDYIKIIPQ
jgi:hypothetical protein